MRLGREQAAGYVEDTEADPVAERALDAQVPTKLTPDPHPQPAVIAG